MIIADGRFNIGARALEYAVPQDIHPSVKVIKRHAATAARAKDDKRRGGAMGRLRDAMAKEPLDALNVWSKILMIDDRWCGATGQGGYWAVASRLCNETAQDELKRRSSFEIPDTLDVLEELNETLPKHRRIRKLSFYLTCGGCPEQYDVHASVRRDTPPVGYVRLRHHRFTVDVLGPKGQLGDDGEVEVIHEMLPKAGEGDVGGWFLDEPQRVQYLTKAAKAIQAELKRQDRWPAKRSKAA